MSFSKPDSFFGNIVDYYLKIKKSGAHVTKVQYCTMPSSVSVFREPAQLQGTFPRRLLGWLATQSLGYATYKLMLGKKKKKN